MQSLRVPSTLTTQPCHAAEEAAYLPVQLGLQHQAPQVCYGDGVALLFPKLQCLAVAGQVFREEFLQQGFSHMLPGMTDGFLEVPL